MVEQDKVQMIKSLIEENTPVSYYVIGGIILIILIIMITGGNSGDGGYGDRLKKLMRLGKR
jgi:hypothetical protein